MMSQATTSSITDDVSIDLACEVIYRFLAAAFANPSQEAWGAFNASTDGELVIEAADLLRQSFASKPMTLGFGELPITDLDARRVVQSLQLRPEQLVAEYYRVFGLISCRECPPYEMEYVLNDEAFHRAQRMADLAGFYRAFGLEPSRTVRDRADHLATELEFAALLLRLQRESLVPADGNDEHYEVCLAARRDFFTDHLIWWLPSFTLAVRHHAESGCYFHLATFLAAFLPIERARFDVEPSMALQQANVSEVPFSCDACLK